MEFVQNKTHLGEILDERRKLRTAKYNDLVKLLQDILGVNIDASKLQPTSVVLGGTYNPRDNTPESVGAKFDQQVLTLSAEDGINRVVEMLETDAPINDAMMGRVITLYKIIASIDVKVANETFNLDRIKNRELLTIIYALNFTTFRGEEGVPTHIPAELVYPVIFYIITGHTNYVRTFREFNKENLSIGFTLDSFLSFLTINEMELAQEFRRNRSLMMYMKNKYPFPVQSYGTISYSDVKRQINAISRLSRKVNIVHSQPDNSTIIYETKPTRELTRMLYAGDTITVRNGRQYVVEGRENPYDTDRIKGILSTRTDIFSDEQRELARRGWHLAYPASAKQGLGFLPNFSAFHLINNNAKVGVTWGNKATDYVDLDLSGTLYDEQGEVLSKIGWNGDKRVAGIEEYDITYSGDMAHLVPNTKTGKNETSEFVIVNAMPKRSMLILDLTNFSGDEDTYVNLVVGDEIIPFEQPQNTVTIGIIFAGAFWVYRSNTGMSNVSKSEIFNVARRNFIKYLKDNVAKY